MCLDSGRLLFDHAYAHLVRNVIWPGMFICSSNLFHISLGKDVPGLNFMVVTLQVESGIFIDRTISNRIWNLYLLPSPLSIRMLLEIGQRCSSKVQIAWMLSSVSLFFPNGVHHAMVVSCCTDWVQLFVSTHNALQLSLEICWIVPKMQYLELNVLLWCGVSKYKLILTLYICLFSWANQQ